MGFRIPKSWQILKRFSREPLHIKIFEECHKKFESDFFLAHIPTDDYNEWINIDGYNPDQFNASIVGVSD